MKRLNLKRKLLALLVGAGLTLSLPGTSIAGVDTTAGDTAIYGGATGTYQPNVLFLIDDSGSMSDPPPNSPPAYDPSVTYPSLSVCSAMLDDPSKNFRYAALETPTVVSQPKVNRAPVKPARVDNAIAKSLTAPVFAGTAGSSGARQAVPSRASWNDTVVSVTSAIWDGKAPEYVRVALHAISGTITTSSGSHPLAGVTVALTGCNNGNGSNSICYTGTSGSTPNYTTTDANGNYSLNVGTASSTGQGTYTITPLLSGNTFSPTSQSVIINTYPQNPTGIDFTVSTTYTISGHIKLSAAAGGTAVSGVTVTATAPNGAIAGTATTDVNGYYTISYLLTGLTYTVTPSAGSTTFSPNNPYPSVTISGSNGTQDFTASAPVYKITGSVSTGGNPIGGATLSVTNSSGTVVATVYSSATGAYTVSNLPAGTYTVAVSLAGFTFSTSSRSVTVNSTNGSASGQNFTGTGSTYEISGQVTSGGSGLNGVTITVTDAFGVVWTATTSGNGNSKGTYSITGLPGAGATYTVVPSKSGYTFTPVSSQVTINSSNVTANFADANGGGGGGGGGGGSTISCASNTIYHFNSTGNGGFSTSGTYNTWGNLSDGIISNCNDPANGKNAYPALTTTGIWVGTLSSSIGTCTATDTAGTFFLGNWLNWANQTVSTASGTSKMTIAKNVVSNLIQNTPNVRMGMLTFDSQNKGGNFVTLGNGYTSYVDYTTTGSIGGTTNRYNLLAAVATLNASTMTPLAGALYESMQYYMGHTSWVHPSTNYISPIQSACQTNFVIVITDGMSTSDQAVVTASGSGTFGAYCANGDCDGDGATNNKEQWILGMDPGSGSDYMDDVAYYMHHNDMINFATQGASKSYDLNGNVLTDQTYLGSSVAVYTIGFALDPADLNDLMGIQLLTDTAANGGGTFTNVKDATSLTSTLSSIVGSILQVNTSFVAPVVPVSPANRTYTGNSVYIGLFLPQQDGFWLGNLKKFGFTNNQVVDITGMPATSTSGAINSTAQSFWSTVKDGGLVKEGGTGSVMLDPTRQGPAKRNLYTYLGTATIPTTANAFTVSNTALTPAMLGYTGGTALTNATNFTNTLNFVWGYLTSGATGRDWILGDILHSEPAVVNYNSNLSVIYVGGNDGILHAFVDINPMNCGTPVNTSCASAPSPPNTYAPLESTTSATMIDGMELWGFLPPDILPNLANLTSANVHGYGVDGSPAVYIRDANGNGVINPADCVTVSGVTTCDQVILVFGERRGGHAYWAMDVTNPLRPQFLWKIDNTTTGFGEMGETFSQPAIGPANINGASSQVAFLGGGYDNTHEDTLPAGTDTQGRGIYAVDLHTGALVWSWVNGGTNSTGANPVYSMPSDITAVDSNNNGAIDTLYVGDVGGQMWRFNIGGGAVSAWTGSVIFKSNPGFDGSTARKIFYPPDITYETGYSALFFGTGDREHPSTPNSPVASPYVVDRLYSIFDSPNYTGTVFEGGTNPTSSSNVAPLAQDMSGNTGAVLLGNAAGWYLRLDGTSSSPGWTGDGKGEKMLSAPLVLNKVVYFTTYDPSIITTSGICGAGLGTAFLWKLNYLTGAFISGTGPQNLGGGIPSGVVVAISGNGMIGLVGVGGGVQAVNLVAGAQYNIIYWHQPY